MDIFYFVPLALFGLILNALVGAVLLRISIHVANKMLKLMPTEEENLEQIESANSPSSSSLSDNPYISPSSYESSVTKPTKKPIPDPGFGMAAGISFVQAVIGGSLFLLFGFSALGWAFVIGNGFFVAIVVYAAIIPMRQGQAALVYLLQSLIITAVVASVSLIYLAVSWFS